MGKKLFKHITIFLLLFGMTAVAQNIKTAKYGDLLFEHLSFSDAIKSYEAAMKRGETSQEVYRNLADAYYNNGMYKDANKWYSKILSSAEVSSEFVSADIYFRYVQTLKSEGDYVEADKIMDLMADKFKEDLRVKLYLADKKYLETIKLNPSAFTATLMDNVNTAYSEYGAAMYKGHIIFASSQNRTDYYPGIHSWTNDPFTKLYAAPVYIDGYVGESKPFSKQIEGKLNESTPTFSLDGQTMYFSSNNRDPLKKQEGIIRVELYKATLDSKKKWSNVERLPFNSLNSSTAHPAISPDGKWLYFVSDREGSYGQSDLYRVEILENGSFGSPENLGNKINTEGRESFPFISTNNVLYFASDGRPGFGGLDIYGVKINEDNSFGEVINLGNSVNSNYDDFAFYLDPNCKFGFMTSNRPDGVDKDDLYFIREIDGIDMEFYQSIKGKVYDILSSAGIAGAKVSLYDNNHKLIEEVSTSAQGEYEFKDKLGSVSFTVGVDKEGYNTIELGLPALNKSNGAVLDFGLEGGSGASVDAMIPGVEIKKGDDLFKVLKLDVIYFDLGKYNIRPDAERELYKILEVLRKYPSMRVDVRSHTDVSGSDGFNYQLSQRRAESTINWLVSRGVNRSRLTGRGFGSSMLVNDCYRGVPCPAYKHQENRRSEFVVEDL
ncbi:OmpA family protein [Myroides odoratimimus]|uniref:OmpA family protein n=1 Tax=Myroides odoratimimus TaxID=76832 RepID=UPI0038D3DF1E